MEKNKIKILAIDDSKDNLISLKALIKEAFPDAITLTAMTGGNGLAMAESEDPHVILLDVVMPGMDGFEVCQKLKSNPQTRDIPVVFLTAIKGDKQSRIRALEMGAEAFLAKPIDEIELTTQIRAMEKIKAASEQKRAEKETLSRLVTQKTRELELAHTATLGLLEDLKKENETRRKSEESLRQSEERWRSLMAATPDFIALIDQDDRFQYLNHYAAGYSEKDVIGSRYTQYMPQDSAEIYRGCVEKTLKTGIPQRYEHTAQGDHGIKRIYETHLVPVLGGDQEILLMVVSRDITERKQAEEEIRQQSEQLRMLYEASQRLNRTLNLEEIYQTLCKFLSANTPNDGFAISAFDPETQLISCRAYWMENKWLDVSAFPPIPLEEEGKGTQSIAIRSGQALLIGDFQAQVKTAHTNYAVNAETNTVENEISAEEEEITRSALIVPLKIGGLVTGVIQVMSYRLNAFTENQLKLLEALALHISSAEQNAQLFTRLQTELNDRTQAEEHVRQLNANLEQRVGERTRELQDTQEKLVRQEKLAMLGQLAGGVSHELRNPLGVISNSIYYLNMVQPDADDQVRKYHAMISQEVHNAEKIIGDLLDFARNITPDRELVSVPELVQRVLERHPASPSVQVMFKLPADLLRVNADPHQMQQVLGNLVVNAYQSMSTGGKLTISAHERNHMMAIAVKDSGTGISPEDMNKLFEPLFSTKIKGIGMGLVVSKKLVEANGGRIKVQTKPGKGSTFTIFLPLESMQESS